MLADVDLDLVGELLAAEGAGVHRGMDLLAVGDEGIASEWQVVLPACELSDAADCAVHRAQARTVALAPDHPLVIGRRDLAAALDQRAIRVEKQLSVVD